MDNTGKSVLNCIEEKRKILYLYCKEELEWQQIRVKLEIFVLLHI